MVAYIIILLVFIAFLLLLWFTRPPARKKSYPTVKAGNPDAAYPTRLERKDLDNKKYVWEGQVIDPSEYEIFIVQGSSMKPFAINHNDAVFVKRLYGADRYSVTGSPVIVFEIDPFRDEDNPTKSTVEFKLRKKIGYVDGKRPFDEWFSELSATHPELNDEKSEVRKKFEHCLEVYKGKNADKDHIQLVLSSTFDPEKNKIRYSFHPVKFLYGIVDFAVPYDKIKD